MNETLTSGIATAAEGLSDEALLLWYEMSQVEVAEAQARAQKIHDAIYERMAAREAWAIASDVFVCELTPANTYDQGALVALKECAEITDADLQEMLAPAHIEEVPVADKWNITRLRAKALRFPSVAAIMERARIAGRPRLTFKRREEKDA